MTTERADQALVDTLMAAIADASEDNLARLRGVLADDVRGHGLFIRSEGRDALLDRIAQPAMPVMGMATWRPPSADEGNVSVVGDLPPGLPIRQVRLTVSGDGDRITEIVQEIVEGVAEQSIGIDISGDIAALVDSAFERHEPLVLAYVDAHGHPNASYRGTLQSHGTDALALWVRNPEGGLQNAIPTNPHVSILGSDKAARAHYVFEGRARISNDEAEREAVFSRSSEFERDLDAGRRGLAVIIDLDVVRGGPLGAAVHQRRGS
jgi:general stress protein 26